MAHGIKETKVAAEDTSKPPVILNNPLAFVLSLIGGIVIVLGGLLGASFGFIGGPFGYGEMMGGYGGFMGGMMGGYYGPGMMGGFYGGYGFESYAPWLFGLTVIGLVSGVVVLVSALYMQNKPLSEGRTAGTIILVFSIIASLTVGGFFLIGGVLGIIGGVLALLMVR